MNKLKKIEFAAEKGTRIDSEQIERWRQEVAPKMPPHFFRISLCQMIEQRSRADGHPVRPRQESGDIVICDDLEGSMYAGNMFEAHVLGMARELERIGYTDVANLTDEERKTHERRLHCMSEQVKHVDGIRQKLGLIESGRILASITASKVLPPEM